MKVYFAVLVFFLLAFAGLATGLILKRKGLRGGCSPASDTSRDCECKKATGSNVQEKAGRCIQKDVRQKGEENRPV